MKAGTKLITPGQGTLAALTNEVIPATQKAMDNYLKIMEQNSAASIELVKKGMEAAQTTNYADTQSKVVEFCESSLKSLKAAIPSAGTNKVGWSMLLQNCRQRNFVTTDFNRVFPPRCFSHTIR